MQRSVAKTHRSRRLPIDGALWELLCQRRAEAGSHDVHVFQNRRGGPLSRGPVYRAFIRCCQRAGLQTRTLDPQGQEVNHLDVHSLRKTFATNLIVHRTDPKTVMELLGHSTVAITLNLYAKIHPGTKREAIGRLSYGAGTAAPAVIKLADSG